MANNLASSGSSSAGGEIKFRLNEEASEEEPLRQAPALLQSAESNEAFKVSVIETDTMTLDEGAPSGLSVCDQGEPQRHTMAVKRDPFADFGPFYKQRQILDRINQLRSEQHKHIEQSQSVIDSKTNRFSDEFRGKRGRKMDDYEERQERRMSFAHEEDSFLFSQNLMVQGDIKRRIGDISSTMVTRPRRLTGAKLGKF